MIRMEFVLGVRGPMFVTPAPGRVKLIPRDESLPAPLVTAVVSVNFVIKRKKTLLLFKNKGWLIKPPLYYYFGLFLTEEELRLF